jgi:hypothetical protein
MTYEYVYNILMDFPGVKFNIFQLSHIYNLKYCELAHKLLEF